MGLRVEGPIGFRVEGLGSPWVSSRSSCRDFLKPSKSEEATRSYPTKPS